MLEWSNPVTGGEHSLWFVLGLGYVERVHGEFTLRLYGIPYSTEAGKYATLEAAKAAAELIYSTRRQP